MTIPVIGRPAKEAKTAFPQIWLPMTESSPIVEVLCFFFETGISRLKDKHVFEVLSQLDSQCDPRGASADYRDTAANVGDLAQLAGIDDHRDGFHANLANKKFNRAYCHRAMVAFLFQKVEWNFAAALLAELFIRAWRWRTR